MKNPPRIDRRPELLPPRDQGREATCAVFAMAATREGLLSKPILLAPRYLYYCCKLADGYSDSFGTSLRACVQILRQNGICEESAWPYHSDVDIPSSAAHENGLLYRISGFVRLETVDPHAMKTNMKYWLCGQGCIAAGVWVYDTWLKQQAVRTGVIPNLRGYERRLGGHAICVVGYDDEAQHFIFKNSWGERWGDRGYGYLSFDDMTSTCFEAWGIQGFKGGTIRPFRPV